MKKELLIFFIFLLFGMIIGFPMMLADDDSEENDLICTAEYDPVCGVDGNTYTNACEAQRAGVIIAHEGECGVTNDDNDSGEIVCCHIYGLGGMMKKVNSQYVLMERDGCVTPRGFVGGGREIVSEKRCEEGYTVRIQTALQSRNRIRLNQTEIPESCTRTGSVIKCNIEGGRVMAIMAGQSGNTIVQVRGVNMTTRAELYHHNGKVYGVFENETRAIEYLPDQLKERIRERTQARLNNTNIILNENGEYEYGAEKESRFLGLFKVREKVKWFINSETGEILKERGPWWGFLARDIEED